MALMLASICSLQAMEFDSCKTDQLFSTLERQEPATIEEIQKLVDERANIRAVDEFKQTPLHFAAMRNPNSDISMFLIDLGANVSAVDVNGQTPLHWAAMRNPNPDVSKLLIDFGADVSAVDMHGQTALHLAAMCNRSLGVSELLISCGADVLAQDRSGKPPLYLVAMNFNPDVVRFFIGVARDKGVDIRNIKNLVSETPLHLASSRNGNEQVVRLFLDKGADVKARDEWGKTPLHAAARHTPNPKIVSLLVEAGADVEAVDSKGQTPIDFAHKSFCLKATKDQILKILLAAQQRVAEKQSADEPPRKKRKA